MQALAGGGAGGESVGQPTAEDGLGDDTARVFYGNDTYYVLLRLHQYLYDRCVAAQSLCHEGFQAQSLPCNRNIAITKVDTRKAGRWNFCRHPSQFQQQPVQKLSSRRCTAWPCVRMIGRPAYVRFAAC